MSSHYQDQGYFDKQKELLHGFLDNKNEFTERNIHEIRDKWTRMSDEAAAEKQRDESAYKQYQQQIRHFVEGAINFILYLLRTVEPQTQKNLKFNLRQASLDFLFKKQFLPYLNQSAATVIDALTNVVEHDNEQTATQAMKIIDEILKSSCNNAQYQRQNHIFTDSTLLRLYEFFEKRIDFFVEFHQDLKKYNYKRLKGDPIPNHFADPNFQLPTDPTEEKKEVTIRLCSNSLSFVTQIPQFYIYTVWALDNLIKDETKNRMRNILRKISEKLQQTIIETNFTELLAKVPRNIVQELLGTFSKFLQFFILVMKKDIDNTQGQNPSKFLKDLSDQIKLDSTVSIVIKLLKQCPIDILHQKIDISNRLKQILAIKREPVQHDQVNDRVNEIWSNVVELIDEETIINKQSKLPNAFKASLYSHWLDIIKVLVQGYIPRPDQNVQQSQSLEQMLGEFLNNQIYMEKIFNTLFKILYDQTLPLAIQEKSLDVVRIFLEQFIRQDKQQQKFIYFIDRVLLQYFNELQNNPNPSQQQGSLSLDQMYKEITHSSKYKLLDRLFQMIGMKLAQIRKSLKAAKDMLIRQNKWGVIKKTTPQTGISSMPCNNDFMNEKFIDKIQQYIIDTNVDIEQNLITSAEQLATQVYSYDDEEEYQVNSVMINNYNQFVDYAKDVKSRIFDQLVEIMNRLLSQIIISINKEIVSKSKNKIGPLANATSESRCYPYLSNIQCYYMSKILKNGFLIFEELHDPQRGHNEILEYKKKTIFNFMTIFVTIQDPINFKNIFEPNAKLILKISVSIIKQCPETHCLPNLLQEHVSFPSQQYQADSQASKLNFKGYIEFLLNLFFKELQTTPEMPTPFGYVRHGQVVNLNQEPVTQKDQDEYISIIQKLIRIPIRLFPRIKQIPNEEQVVKPYIKQLILFFVKKSHETLYPIDYLGLLLSLVKRIPTPNQMIPDSQNESLSKYFQQLCDKHDRSDKVFQRTQNDPYHRINLSGVNIVLNMFELYSTGIVEIQDIVAEVVANFPLQKPLQVSLAKQYPIYAQCLFRALDNITLNDNQVIQKTLVILESIVQSLSMDELKYFFGDLLQPFIEKLLQFPTEYKMQDIQQKNLNILQDPSFKATKILAKMGSLVRKSDWPIEVRRNHHDSIERNQQLEIQIEGFTQGLNINVTELIRCASELLSNVLENQLATYLFKQSSIQHSYQILKLTLLRYYKIPIDFESDLYKFTIPEGKALEMKVIYHQFMEIEQDNEIQDEELINQITKVFIGLSNLNNIIQTLSTAGYYKIKDDVENIVTTLTDIFFIQLADEHCEQAQILYTKYGTMNIEKQYQLVEEIVQDYQNKQQPAIKWIQHLFKGLSKRYLLTAEENMNLKDFYIQQHEFIWNKLIVGNCLKKYMLIVNKRFNEKNKWCFDIYYSALIRLFEEFVYEKFLKQTQLQKEDDRRRKIQIVQSFGGTMIPSEGLNNRSISIELLGEIQNFKPKFKDYFSATTITGLPFIPDVRIFQCSFILLKQLPESIKVISQVITKQLLIQTIKTSIENKRFKIELNEDYSLVQRSLNQQLELILKVIVENLNTHKQSLVLLIIEIFEMIRKDLYDGDSSALFYQSEQIKQIKDLNHYWINSSFTELQSSSKPSNLKDILLIIDSLLTQQQMSDIQAQRYANGFRLLTYLIQLQGLKNGQSFFLFKCIEFSENINFDETLESYIQLGFDLIKANEETYGRHSKLIHHPGLAEDSQQQGKINVLHYLDDLECKINIEHIDFEIKWQSYMISSIFGFLKSISTIPYVFYFQKYYQKTIDKKEVKPSILSIKFKTVEVLYEGLIRVEQSIRSSAYKYLQELLQQEGVSNDKTLFENDDRLKKVMKPLLTCVQSEIANYVPSFLKSLKLILKIFSKVFHRTLSEKLLQHLGKIVQEVHFQPNQNVYSCTVLEWSSQSSQNQESLSFQIQIINGLMKLFQYLSPQITTASTQASHQEVSKFINNTQLLRRNYILRVSTSQLNQAIQQPLVKFLNTLSVNYFFELFTIPIPQNQINTYLKQLEQILSNPHNQPNNPGLKQFHDQMKDRLRFIKTIRQVLSEQLAFPVREKICRQKAQYQQNLEKFSNFVDQISFALEKGLQQIQTSEQMTQFHVTFSQQMINVFSELKIELIQFGYQQCKRNPVWLKNNNTFLESCVQHTIKELKYKLKMNSLFNQQKEKKIQSPQILAAYNHLTLPVSQVNALLNRQASVLKFFIAQNEDNTQAITEMLRLINYSCHDKVRKWILNVAQHKSVQLRRKIFEIWLENYIYKEDEDSINQAQLVAGYQVIYPILFYSKQRKDLEQIADMKIYQRIKEINEDLSKLYQKITIAIENNVPFNYQYPQKSKSQISDVNHYYKNCVIDMLQITSYLIWFQDQPLHQDLKISFLQFGYDMKDKQDKLIGFHANLYFSKWLKKNGLIQNDPMSVKIRYLKIYNRALKQLDESSLNEQELYALCRKIISFVLPCLEDFDHEQKEWIASTHSLLKQDSNQLDAEQAQKVSRFWTMFIRNHQVFHKHHEAFTIHIINSMQQIGFHIPSQQQQMQMNNYLNIQVYRRIALDMAFLQVEWKTQSIRSELKNGGEAARTKFIQSFYQSEAANTDESLSSEIYQSFFIKQSLKSHLLEDQELQKRALYLLKKILMIVPLTNHKINMESIKKHIAGILQSINDTQQQIQQGRNQQAQQASPYFRFFMVVLHILLIILEFQPQHKIHNLLTSYNEIILNMGSLPDWLQQIQKKNQNPPPQRAVLPQVVPQQQVRQPQQQDRIQAHQQLLASEHLQLVYSIYSIYKKLIKAARTGEQTTTAKEFQEKVFNWCKEMIIHQAQTKRQQPNNMSHAQFLMNQAPRTVQQQQMIRVNMLSIFLLKLFFNYDTDIVRALIPALKRVAEIIIDYLKSKDKGEQYLDNIKKYSIKKKVFTFKRMDTEEEETAEEDVKQYQNCDLSCYMEDFIQEKEDFPFGIEKNEELLYFNDDFPEHQKMKYHLYRSGLQKIIRMIAYNFDEMKDSKEQNEYLQILMQIIEQVGDFELKLECIAIFRMLFLNLPINQQPYIQLIQKQFGQVRANQIRNEQETMKKNIDFKGSKMSYDHVLHFFFDMHKFQHLFDKKIDQRSSDSHDNQHQKIPDLKVFKLYFMFLCEYLLIKPFKMTTHSQPFIQLNGFNSLKIIFERHGAIKDFRKLLYVISKLSTCFDYLRFFYLQVLELFGYSYDRFMTILLGDLNRLIDKEAHTEGEEIMLMGLKFLMLGRGALVDPIVIKPIKSQFKIQVQLKDSDEETKMRESVLQKYLAIYYLKQKLSAKKLYHAALKFLTSEYLPTIVIYNLSYIPIQDIPQQPLRECIIPSAALELMGTAANLSSRLLRPLFTQLLQRVCTNFTVFSQLVDYITVQQLSNGTQGVITQFLIDFCLNLPMPDGLKLIMDNRMSVNQFIKFLIQPNNLNNAQYFLESLFSILSAQPITTSFIEDILVSLQAVYQEQWNKQALFGCQLYQATQPWVKQLVMMGWLREPSQQLLLIQEMDDTQDEFYSLSTQNENSFIQKEIDTQIIQSMYQDALVQLNQWNTLKQIDNLSKQQQLQNKIEQGFRERINDQCIQGWKELSELKQFNLNQNDFYRYNEAFFKFYDFVKDDTMQNQQRLSNQFMPQIEQNLKFAHIINSYKFIKQLPKLTLSYDQMMSSPLIYGQKYLTFVQQSQLYSELEEMIKVYATPTYNTTHPGEQMLDNISNAYSYSITQKKYFTERQPLKSDSINFLFELMSCRQIQLMMGFQKFNFSFQSLLNNQQQQPILDYKQYFLAFLDPKTVLFQMRYYWKNKAIQLFDESQVLREIPKQIQPYAEKLIQIEMIKYKTLQISEVENNLTQLSEIQAQFIQMISTIGSSEDMKNYLLARIMRLKVRNLFYKLLKLDENLMQSEERQEKIETYIQQYNEYFFKQQLNHFKLWKEIQDVYLMAHKKYNNNISYAHHYISSSPLSVQYKPNKYPLQLIPIFNMITITNPSDSLVLESFCQVITQIPSQILLNYIPQLINLIINKANNQQVRDSCWESLRQIQNNQQLQLQLALYAKRLEQKQHPEVDYLISGITSLIQSSDKIDELLGSIFENKIYEELLYESGRVLDSIELDIPYEDVKQCYASVMSKITNNSQLKVSSIYTEPFVKLQKQLQGISDLYKSMSIVHEWSLTQICKIQQKDLNYLNLLTKNYSTQMSTNLLYELNLQIQTHQLQMFGTKLQNVKISAIFPTITYTLTKRKRFIRLISFLGNNEKKYTFSLKRCKQNKYFKQFQEQQLAHQFINFADQITQSFSENIQCPLTQQFVFQCKGMSLMLETYADEKQPLSNLYEKELAKLTNDKPFYTNNPEIKELIPKNALLNQILKFCKTIDTYVTYKKNIYNTFAVQSTISFLIGSSCSPKQLENLYFNFSNGDFEQKKFKFNVKDGKLQLYDQYAVRYSRNIQQLISELNLNTYVYPLFITIIQLLLGQKTVTNLQEYMIQLCFQLGCQNDSEKMFKKFKDIIYTQTGDFDLINLNCERVFMLSKDLFNDDSKHKKYVRQWF